MTTRPLILIHNQKTGKQTQREMNDQEFAQYEADLAAQKARQAEQAAEQASLAAAKQAAQDKLKALGLTDLEIAAITGA